MALWIFASMAASPGLWTVFKDVIHSIAFIWCLLVEYPKVCKGAKVTKFSMIQNRTLNTMHWPKAPTDTIRPLSYLLNKRVLDKNKTSTTSSVSKESISKLLTFKNQ